MSLNQSFYSQILQELEKRANYEATAKPRDISKLRSIKKLLDTVGNPQNNFKIIHIAGTNGKGLTGAMISQILDHKGLKVGLYSSPHVIDVRERIILNGEWVSKAIFAHQAKSVLEAADQCADEVSLSYFDLFTAIALLIFQEADVDWAILETGLGGKADSTNITDKELSVITQIDYDHVNILGTSLKVIAQEKMGIARPNIPVVLGKQSHELSAWMTQELQACKSEVYLAEKLRIVEIDDGKHRFQWPDGVTNECDSENKRLTIPYLACLQNALMACMVIYPSSDLLTRQKWIQSATQVVLRGRLEFRKNVLWESQKLTFPFMIFDGGHNASAVSALVRELVDQKVKEYVLILGIAEDKLISQLHEPLFDLCQRASHIILTKAQSLRSASPEMIEQFIGAASRTSGKINILPTIEKTTMIKEALKIASSYRENPIVISGSFYLLGELFQMLNPQEEK